MENFEHALDNVEQQLTALYEADDDPAQCQPTRGVILMYEALADAGFESQTAAQVASEFMINLPPEALDALEDHSLLDTLAGYMDDAYDELSKRLGHNVAVQVLKNWVAKIEFEPS